MKSMHFAFCPEQQYGHIIPTLGLALELARRGHRVSYAIIEPLAPLIRHLPVRPIIVDPMLDSRTTIVRNVYRANDCSKYNSDESAIKIAGDLIGERTSRLLEQFEQLYRHDMPNAIVHDDIFDKAGREFALKFGLAKIRLRSQFIEPDDPALPGVDPFDRFVGDEVILVLVPRFFQRRPEMFENDGRFRFVGFIPEGRSQLFGPWDHGSSGIKPILVTATTGTLPQLDFCQVMVDVARAQQWDMVLSMPGALDAVSAIDSAALNDIPKNVQVNIAAGNFQILEKTRLYIGQGGQGGALEAIYWGVPQLVIPPTPYHYLVGRRVVELGLGACLPIAELSREIVVQQVDALLNDEMTLQRVKDASDSMRSNPSARIAADEIEAYVSGRSR